MSDNTIEMLRPAPRGSKKGWPSVTAQLPPDVYEQLQALALSRRTFRGDLVRFAVESLLEREAAA